MSVKGGTFLPPLNVMLKPVSDNCNLACKYCFYHSPLDLEEEGSNEVMDVSLLEEIIKKSLAEAEQFCSFIFQGGEPTLAGLEFYQRVVELQKKYKVDGLKVYNNLQTNSLAIDQDWANFLAENNFLVGLSLDGHQAIHDANRITKNGDGSFQQVMKTADLLQAQGVEYNILAVITSQLATKAEVVYDFYKEQGFKFLQFIPCLEALNEQTIADYYLSAEQYGNFLTDLFTCWYQDLKAGQMISIQYFDNLVQIAAGQRAESCSLQSSCNYQFVIETDGSVYPCDFYVQPRWELGNIKKASFKELQRGKKLEKFISTSRYINSKCKECKYFRFCRCGCRRNREPFIANKPDLNRFCAAYQKFFAEVEEKIYELAELMKDS